MLASTPASQFYHPRFGTMQYTPSLNRTSHKFCKLISHINGYPGHAHRCTRGSSTVTLGQSYSKCDSKCLLDIIGYLRVLMGTPAFQFYHPRFGTMPYTHSLNQRSDALCNRIPYINQYLGNAEGCTRGCSKVSLRLSSRISYTNRYPCHAEICTSGSSKVSLGLLSGIQNVF